MNFQEFKQAASHAGLDDERITALFLETRVESREEVAELLVVLDEHRPNVVQKMSTVYVAMKFHPELFICSKKELTETAKKSLSLLGNILTAMKHRGVDEGWWGPEKVLEAIDWINEEYGWEGVGR